MIDNKCNLAIASWNIDYIFSRVDNERICKPDDVNMIEQICKFDIVGLNDHLLLENYFIYQLNRKKIS